MPYDKSDIKRRMDGAIDALNKEFSGLRTGRASAALLDTVSVDVYGAKMPLNQVGSVSVPEPRLLVVQVWDASNTKAVERGIMEAGLGLNPQTEGTMIRLPIPDLNEERRKELTKVASKYAENTRIAVRNVRRDGLGIIKKDEVSEDESKRLHEEVQKMTDATIKQVDKLLSAKETDIMTV